MRHDYRLAPVDAGQPPGVWLSPLRAGRSAAASRGRHSRKLRPDVRRPSPYLSGEAGAAIRSYALACEGPHTVALMPAAEGGYRWAWFRFQPVTGKWQPCAVAARRDAVLSALYYAECRHAFPLGTDGPCHGDAGHAVQLHAHLCGPGYPADASRLSAADAAAVPHVYGGADGGL